MIYTKHIVEKITGHGDFRPAADLAVSAGNLHINTWRVKNERISTVFTKHIAIDVGCYVGINEPRA